VADSIYSGPATELHAKALHLTVKVRRAMVERTARALGLDPAVARLIANVVEFGRATGKEVSVCGDLASEPDAVSALLDLGVRRLSVAPAALGRVKAAIAAHG